MADMNIVEFNTLKLYLVLLIT